MDFSVAPRTQRNQVLLNVGSKGAPEAHVVHFEISQAPTALAPPAIALKHLAAQLLVTKRVQPNPILL